MMHYNHDSLSPECDSRPWVEPHFAAKWRKHNNFALVQISNMEQIGLPLVIHLCLAFGIAGLLWPEKLKPVLETLMFPWFPSYRVLRNHSVGAILLSVVLLVAFIARLHLGIQ